MGVTVWDLIPRRTIDREELSTQVIALDAFNTLYYFLAVIRHRTTGEPLKDHAGRITSHLSGLLYRTVSFLEVGIKPVFVFNGHYPHFKRRTVRQRRARREAATRKWKEAVRRGLPAFKYAQAAARINADIVETSKELLRLMGVPWIQAPSEGEAQCAWMCQQGLVYATASQDFDSLLFGSSRLIRNLSVIARKEPQSEEVYAEVDPELIELQHVLTTLQLTREQLVLMGLLIGTDYNERVEGVGPATALKLVRAHKTLERVLAACRFPGQSDIKQIYEFFLHPPHTDHCPMAWKPPDIDSLVSFLVRQHAFSQTRVQAAAQRLQTSFDRARDRLAGSAIHA